MEPREVLAVDEIELSDLDFWARPPEEREGAFQTLRRERPVARMEEADLRERSALVPPPGPGYWAVTRHAHVVEASRHPETYCSGKGAVSVVDLPEPMVEYFSGMISTDNPRHARLRRIVSAAFTPNRVRSLEARVEEVAAEIVDKVAPAGACDFVTEVAAPLPLRVICDMMGIPEPDRPAVMRCANVILSEADPEYVPEDADPVAAFVAAGQELTDLMHAIGHDRLAHPAGDLTTALVTANADGELLTHAELASLFILLVVAGNETTRNAIAHGLVALTEHPDQRAVLQADVKGVLPTAVEEIVRWASPVTWMRRTVTVPTTLGDQALEPGDKVLLFYGSANRDEDAFCDPHRFDVRRAPNPHLGFGAAGPHFCLGAHLARREIGVMWRQLLTRLPDISASGPPERLRSTFVNGIKHLPCTFTPRQAARARAG